MNTLYESDRALHQQQSLILPAPNHLEWEFCRVYNIWVCMPLQQSGPEPCGETALLILLLFFHYVLQLCSKKSHRYSPLFDLQCVGVKPALGAVKSKTPSGRRSQPPPVMHKVPLSLKARHVSPTQAGQSLSVPRTIRLNTAPLNQLCERLPKGLTSPTFPICC